jgi:hypothetical protein
MTIDKFTKEDFEAYLTSDHSPFQSLGLIDGEETYLLPLDNQIGITIRSSIKSNGLSANVASDSIRAWLVNGDRPLGIKTRTYRQPGWEVRLNEKIKQLASWRTLAGDCKKCNQPKGIFRVAKDGDNKGRPFAKCNCAHSQKLDDNFIWLDKPIEISKIWFSEESKNDSDTAQAAREMAYSNKEKENISKNMDKDTLRDRSVPEQSKGDISNSIKDKSHLQESPRSPNPAQQSAIEADVNSDLRVLAGPGSGKTFVIEHRYKFLIDSGISPQGIIVCTFGKTAATEMGQRILGTCPQANLEQICTIHALCYRLLAKWYPDSRWYKWGGPKDWQVKKCLEDAIGIVWREKEKPSAQEVYDFINTSKYLSLTADDSYEWFVGTLDQDRGEWLYEIRCKFDAWLNRSRFLTYADQLYLVEKRLQADSEWRTMLQEKFTHVIVDEGQDTNLAAMRILVTLSLEPGMNTVYESEAVTQ